MDCAKTTVRRGEKHLRWGFSATYIRCLTVHPNKYVDGLRFHMFLLSFSDVFTNVISDPFTGTGPMAVYWLALWKGLIFKDKMVPRAHAVKLLSGEWQIPHY